VSPTGVVRQIVTLLMAFVVLWCAGGADRAAAQSAGVADGLLVTLSATADELEPAAGEPPGGLVVRITLENQTGGDLTGLRLLAPIPPRTRVTASWLGNSDQRAGAITEEGVFWSGLALRDGEQLGPFTYRLVPADGAHIFLDAAVQPAVDWSGPRVGRATVGRLPLRGLWGDAGLRRTLLPGGLTVLTGERPETDTVMLRVAVLAGARDEDDVTHGGSHWLEHGHLLGTAARPTAPDRGTDRAGRRPSERHHQRGVDGVFALGAGRAV
jgi:hypothetical protein